MGKYSSNHPFSGAFAVSFTGGYRLSEVPSVMHFSDLLQAGRTVGGLRFEYLQDLSMFHLCWGLNFPFFPVNRG